MHKKKNEKKVKEKSSVNRINRINKINQNVKYNHQHKQLQVSIFGEGL